jgi:aminoglycoside phosphotransferase (APT) family kinase protein
MNRDNREQRFDDGNVSDVVRVGDTVRRTAGPWTPAVHALLRHLEARGFDGAPRARGLDDRGREVLTYVEGRTGPASLEGIGSDEVLVAVAQLVRRYHDAVADFQPPPDAEWRFTVGAPRSGEVICHNDLGPWNIVFVGARPIALIDWDFAAPAPRAWDLAYALWRFVPLYGGGLFGTPADQARRIHLFCDAYGMADRRDLLAVVERRQQVLHDTLVVWGQAGMPGFAAMLRDGHADGIRDDIAYLRRNRQALEKLRHLS